MTALLSYTTTLDTLTCGSCSIPFAIPHNLHTKVRADGSEFWCPNGHKIHYFEDENAKLKKQLRRSKEDSAFWSERAEAERRDAVVARRQAAARKGQLTKLKNRIANGVCPCCRRNFANVKAHIAGQHPDFVIPE